MLDSHLTDKLALDCAGYVWEKKSAVAKLELSLAIAHLMRVGLKLYHYISVLN